MKTFQSAKWDLDAENDTFQELFQKPKKKNKIIDNQKKRAKKQVRELKKRMNQNNTDDTINLIKTSSNKKLKTKFQEKSINKNRNSKQIDSFNLNTNSNIEQSIKNKKKVSKHKQSNETINLVENDYKLLKNQKKKLKKLEKKLKSKLSKTVSNTGLLKLNKQKNNSDLLDTEMNVTKKKSEKKTKDVSHESHTTTDRFLKKDTQPFKNPISKVKKLIFNDQSFTENLLEQPKTSSLKMKKKAKFFEKLKGALNSTNVDKKPVQTLRQKMMEKLKAARFRFINEQIYTTDGKEAQKIFQNDPDAFKAYHDGYRKQVKSWPMNPLDVIIDAAKKMPKTHVIADFGCGDARLSKSVVQKVHSFDLVATDDTVVACDMSKVPLENNSIDVAVFCLSLMGTNLRDYLFEANRVLKVGGVLKVAEVESRFENVEDFIKGVQHFGFKNTWKDLSHNLFYFIDFKKEKNIGNRNKLPTLSLLPCLYKKR